MKCERKTKLAGYFAKKTKKFADSQSLTYLSLVDIPHGGTII